MFASRATQGLVAGLTMAQIVEKESECEGHCLSVVLPLPASSKTAPYLAALFRFNYSRKGFNQKNPPSDSNPQFHMYTASDPISLQPYNLITFDDEIKVLACNHRIVIAAAAAAAEECHCLSVR